MPARSDKYTFVNKIPVYYSDFTDGFDLNPQTELLTVLTNENSVKQSIKNLVLTNKFERFYEPIIGSKVQSLNFEMNDPATASLLQEQITETITNFEPRVQQLTVRVQQDIDSNQIAITVIFTTLNIQTPVSFSFILPRTR